MPAGDSDEGGQVTSEHFFPAALTVSGLQHVLFNLAQDVHTSIEGWSTFWKQLKVFEALLGSSENRRKLHRTCFADTAMDARASAELKTWSVSLHEARWLEVLKFVSRFKEIHLLLKGFWREKAWLRKADDEGHGDGAEEGASSAGGSMLTAGRSKVVPAAITQALRDPMFDGYMELSLQIEGATKHLAFWCRGCICHQYLTLSEPSMGRRALSETFSQQFSGRWHSCPCSGRRAPELAVDKVGEILTQVWADFERALLRGLCRSGLGTDDRTRIVREYNAARVHVAATLRIKLGYWQSLPWLLAGVAHHDEQLARRTAQAALDNFDSDPRECAQHRITWKLLRPGAPFRAELEKVARGESRWQRVGCLVRLVVVTAIRVRVLRDDLPEPQTVVPHDE